MESNKQVVLKVLQGAFVERDVAVVERYFSPDYMQHNPTIPNGPRAIASLIPTLKEDLTYEVGMVIAEGDLVMARTLRRLGTETACRRRYLQSEGRQSR